MRQEHLWIFEVGLRRCPFKCPFHASVGRNVVPFLASLSRLPLLTPRCVVTCCLYLPLICGPFAWSNLLQLLWLEKAGCP